MTGEERTRGKQLQREGGKPESEQCQATARADKQLALSMDEPEREPSHERSTIGDKIAETLWLKAPLKSGGHPNEAEMTEC